MKQTRVVLAMLRFRVASLLLPFFLLAPALHGELRAFRWTYLAGILALCSSYVVATCLNDVFDLEIDRINHPQARDRPLVSGDATPPQLIAIAIGSGLVALGAAVAIGPLAVGLVSMSLLLNVAYSVPPIRLCAHALLATPVLAFAYVALPFGMGLASTGLAPNSFDARVAVCFMVLFTGRMLLKDFRDRRGDAAFGKRTFLLVYGKRATLTATLVCIVVGNGLLLTVLPQNLLLIAVTESYFTGIGFELYRLWAADNLDGERLAISLGARMGNAVVLTLLGFVLLQAAGASATEQLMLVVVFAAAFWFAFLYLARRPQEAQAAYRG